MPQASVFLLGYTSQGYEIVVGLGSGKIVDNESVIFQYTKGRTNIASW